VRRLLAALVVTGLALSGFLADQTRSARPAAAAINVINFDDRPANTVITNQYAPRGVTFTGSGAYVISNATIARSDPNVITCTATPEFCSGAVTGTFSPQQSRVKVWVGRFTNGSGTVTLRAFNAAGSVIGQQSHSYPFSRTAPPVAVALEVSVATPVISRFDVISSDYHGNTAIDDLEFERPDPVLTLDPSCRGSNPQTLTVAGSGFAPNGSAQVVFDPNGPEQQVVNRLPINASGVFSTTFSANASGRAVSISANDTQGLRADTRWAPCPPPGVTTTAPPTTEPPPPDSVPDTTAPSTTRPGIVTIPTTSTTIPTIITIPPPTPGASLSVDPSLGPGGFVTRAGGTGFPPGQPVTLGWSPGIGIYSATAGPDGTFESSVLVMNRDVLGPRTLVATSGGVAASASFLVVPSTVQPSGKDVAQITRVRRFLQR